MLRLWETFPCRVEYGILGVNEKPTWYEATGDKTPSLSCGSGLMLVIVGQA